MSKAFNWAFALVGMAVLVSGTYVVWEMKRTEPMRREFKRIEERTCSVVVIEYLGNLGPLQIDDPRSVRSIIEAIERDALKRPIEYKFNPRVTRTYWSYGTSHQVILLDETKANVTGVFWVLGDFLLQMGEVRYRATNTMKALQPSSFVGAAKQLPDDEIAALQRQAAGWRWGNEGLSGDN